MRALFSEGTFTIQPLPFLWIALVVVVALAWWAWTLRAAYLRVGWRVGWVLASVLRALACAAVIGAILQLSWKRPTEEGKSRRVPVIIDGSESFHVEQRVRDLNRLMEIAPLDTCWFGEQGVRRAWKGQSEAGTQQKDSRFSSLLQCLALFRSAGYAPERVVVWTDSQLNWDAHPPSLPVTWVHEEATRAKRDAAVRIPSERQFFFVGTVNQLTVEVRNVGIGQTLRLAIVSPAGLLKTVDVPPTGWEWEPLTITLSAQDSSVVKAGMPLRFQLAVLTEEANAHNNEAVLFPVWAPHKVRVLHVSGSPSTDAYYLRRWLKTQPNFEVVSFYILRDFTDDNTVPQEESALIPFPVERLFGDELNKFQVVILQNFEVSSFLTGDLVRRLKRFLQTPGKGLLLMGGPRSFKPQDLSHQDWGRLLPFLPRGEVGASTYEQLARSGQWTWSDELPFPDLLPILRAPERVPAVDAIHKLDLHASARPWAGLGGATPRWLIASRDSEDGRVLMVLTDQLFRWILEASDLNLGDRYQQFMDRAIRWLSFHERESGSLALTPSLVFAGQTFQVKGKRPLPIHCSTQKYTVTEVAWAPKEPGFCEAKGTPAQWVYASGAEAEKRLEAPPLAELKARVEGWGATWIPSASPSQWRELLRARQVERGEAAFHVKAIWTHPLYLAGLLLLLLGDWWLRRRSGLG